LVVLGGTLTQNVFSDDADAVHVAEEVDDVLRAREQWQMAEDDDAVETVVYECQQAAKQPRILGQSRSTKTSSGILLKRWRCPPRISDSADIFKCL
jgi:hypothetical protein